MALLEMSAAVLIGGKSRRMGSPKALLRLAPDGPTMVEIVVERIGRIASEILLVGSPGWELPASLASLERVSDRGQSAADGIVAALGAAQHDLCLIVGCDMPLLDHGVVENMAREAQGEGRGVVAVDASGVHPLHAVWRTDARETVEALVASGERSLTRLVEAVGMLPLDVTAPGLPESARWSVFNVNTPEDLEVARALWSMGDDGQAVYSRR